MIFISYGLSLVIKLSKLPEVSLLALFVRQQILPRGRTHSFSVRSLSACDVEGVVLIEARRVCHHPIRIQDTES